MVKATPVRSSLISLRTKEEGVFVGKGPSVSVGVTVQLPEVVVVVVEEVEVVDAVSFLQALMAGITMPIPNAASPFRKNVFLSMFNVLGDAEPYL